jgi:HPr Serine kinase C-terminal domain.
VHEYFAFGLCIESDIKLSKLLPNTYTQNIDLKIRKDITATYGIDKPNEEREFIKISNSELWLSIQGVGYFLVRNGTEILYYPDSESNVDNLKIFLLGSCIGAALYQRRQFIIHGNAIEVDGKAVIFAGQSGIGKSTLAAIYHQNGFKVLTDDLALIRSDLHVIPSYPNIKLWEDSATNLSYDTSGLSRVRDNVNKYECPISNNFRSSPAELKAIFILGSHNEMNIISSPLSGIEKFIPLKNNTYRKNYLKAMNLNQHHMNMCTAIASNVPIIALTRPKAGFKLKELFEFSLNEIRQL